ncbi:hypothetical protein GGR77_000072 [Xanthomonas translucens]
MRLAGSRRTLLRRCDSWLYFAPIVPGQRPLPWTVILDRRCSCRADRTAKVWVRPRWVPSAQDGIVRHRRTGAGNNSPQYASPIREDTERGPWRFRIPEPPMQQSSSLSPCVVSARPVVRARAWRSRSVVGACACCRRCSICTARKRASWVPAARAHGGTDLAGHGPLPMCRGPGRCLRAGCDRRRDRHRPGRPAPHPTNAAQRLTPGLHIRLRH